MRKNRTQNK